MIQVSEDNDGILIVFSRRQKFVQGMVLSTTHRLAMEKQNTDSGSDGYTTSPGWRPGPSWSKGLNILVCSNYNAIAVLYLLETRCTQFQNLTTVSISGPIEQLIIKGRQVFNNTIGDNYAPINTKRLRKQICPVFYHTLYVDTLHLRTLSLSIPLSIAQNNSLLLPGKKEYDRKHKA